MKLRMKSARQVLAELDGLVAAGWRGPVFFVDDNLIGSPRYVKQELLPAPIAWQRVKGPIPFNTQVSINLADDPAMMVMMSEAGFDTVFVGIETPEVQSLAECGKQQNRGRTGGRREAHSGCWYGSPGRIHRRLRPRRSRHLRPANRVHPEERHRDRHGGAAAGPSGTRLYERMKKAGPSFRSQLGRQRGRDDATSCRP